MDIMEVWAAYHKDANPDDIAPMYRQCALNAKARDYGGIDLLHIASRHAHPEVVAWLLEQGMDPNRASGSGCLPLFLLAEKSFSRNYSPREGDIYRTALLLLDAGAKTSRRDSSGKFCWHVAAQRGNAEFLRALTEHGVKLNKADRDGNTGLHLIVEACRNPLDELENIARDIAQLNSGGFRLVKTGSPFAEEEMERQINAIAETLALRKKAGEDMLQDLFRCAVVLLDAGVDVEAENDMLVTAHTLAVRAGAKKIAALLDGSLSPEEEQTAAGREIIAAGGMTFHQAVLYGDEAAVRALAARGEDIDAVSDQHPFEGLSPLAVACRACNVHMASLLLDLGADLSRKNAAGEQPVVALFSPQIMLHPPKNLYKDRLAAQLVALLSRHGFDPDGRLNDQGDCLLGLACASPNGRGNGLDSVIGMVVEEAISLGADVNRKNDAGLTPLMLSCAGDFQTMEDVQTALLEAGADVTLRDEEGNTALHYAAQQASPRKATAMTELMLDFGEPDVSAVNLSGKTALDYAVERDNAQLVKLLLPYMK